MDGGATGTNGNRFGTSGGWPVTSGNARGLGWAIVIGLPLWFAIQLYADVQSISADSARAGSPRAMADIWGSELTSFASWLLVAIGVFLWTAWLAPARFGWVRCILGHIAGALAASLCHITLMVAFREILWAAWGMDYGPGIFTEFGYELRKDIPTYIIIVLASALVQALSRKANEAGADAAMFEIGDGSRTIRLPIGEIDHVEAAGNYVEVHAGETKHLARGTLAGVEERLGEHGFARIHRSRLVRRGAIRSIDTMPSGDFTLTLADGSELRGSRRYRDRLD